MHDRYAPFFHSTLGRGCGGIVEFNQLGILPTIGWFRTSVIVIVGMKPGNDPKKRLTLASPWFVEILALCLVLWQEGLRLELRTSHCNLPVNRSLQDFYFYNFGDFSNGFVFSFVIDGLVDVIRNLTKQRSSRLRAVKPQSIALLASFLSATIIILFELRTSAYNNADLADIPSGIAGALCYLIVRLACLAYRK